MKLLSLTLTNILAYAGQTRIDLSRADADRNVIIVWGRNGKGKTSFINALKMLFAGIEDERWRKVGFPPRALPPGQFVRGDGEHWIGVVNRQASQAAQRKRESVTASVEAVLERDGEEIVARRSWILAPDGNHVEDVEVSDANGPLKGPAAVQRLADVLPADYVEFFFFDGEDVKALAETAERKNIDFDRLLRITFAADLAHEIANLATDRRRRTLDRGERERLRMAQRELDDATFTQAEATRELTQIDEDIRNRQVDLRRFQTVRENLSAGASEAQREALEKQRRKLRSDLSNALNEMVATVPLEAPLIANLPLVMTALAAIEARLAAAGAAEQGLVRRIRDGIPRWISEAAPELSSEARERLSTALRDRVSDLVIVQPGGGIFGDLDLARAERVRAQLMRIAAAGGTVRAANSAKLLEAARIASDLRQAEEDLMRIEVGSQSNLERYRAVVSDVGTIENELAELNQRRGMLTARRAAAAESIAGLEARLSDVERRHVRADQDESDAREMERVARVLNEVLQRMRELARQRVQELLNVHFRTLVYDHALIDRIEIDESYTLVFLDDAHRRIGRASLSSGLKQLAATALLWAMKDAAGFAMPVVIDTPLGRIDRENQDNMLTSYYPNLSHQVVLLPTNAEIDQRKRNLLAPYIADEWLIENETGDAATIARGRLVRD